MNYNLICYILGRLVMAEALILIVPLGIALWNGESRRLPFAISEGLGFLGSRLWGVGGVGLEVV